MDDLSEIRRLAGLTTVTEETINQSTGGSVYSADVKDILKLAGLLKEENASVITPATRFPKNPSAGPDYEAKRQAAQSEYQSWHNTTPLTGDEFRDAQQDKLDSLNRKYGLTPPEDRGKNEPGVISKKSENPPPAPMAPDSTVPKEPPSYMTAKPAAPADSTSAASGSGIGQSSSGSGYGNRGSGTGTSSGTGIGYSAGKPRAGDNAYDDEDTNLRPDGTPYGPSSYLRSIMR